MPICSSKPSAVCRGGTAITPALLTSRSSGSSPSSARRTPRTEARSARSSAPRSHRRVGTSASTRRTACSSPWPGRARSSPPAPRGRRAPARSPARGRSSPPVTTARRPVRSGMSAAVQPRSRVSCRASCPARRGVDAGTGQELVGTASRAAAAGRRSPRTGQNDIARSACAVMVSDGLAPRLAETAAPSTTCRPGMAEHPVPAVDDAAARRRRRSGSRRGSARSASSRAGRRRSRRGRRR